MLQCCHDGRHLCQGTSHGLRVKQLQETPKLLYAAGSCSSSVGGTRLLHMSKNADLLAHRSFHICARARMLHPRPVPVAVPATPSAAADGRTVCQSVLCAPCCAQQWTLCCCIPERPRLHNQQGLSAAVDAFAGIKHTFCFVSASGLNQGSLPSGFSFCNSHLKVSRRTLARTAAVVAMPCN